MSDQRSAGVIHEAGEPMGLVQKCIRCGMILSDYRNMVSAGPWSPSWWQGTVTIYPSNPQMLSAGRGDNATQCLEEL